MPISLPLLFLLEWQKSSTWAAVRLHMKQQCVQQLSVFIIFLVVDYTVHAFHQLSTLIVWSPECQNCEIDLQSLKWLYNIAILM